MPKHLTTASTTINHDAVFPGWGSVNKVAVPPGILKRIVFATFLVQGGTTGSSEVQQTVTPSGGAAILDTIGRMPGGAGEVRAEATIILKPGGEYFFVRGVGSGGAVDIVDYSYIDIG